MSSFLENVVLPELIKPSDKDKLESNIVLIREAISDAFIPEIKTSSPDKILAEDLEIISNFVKEKSGYKKYLDNRFELYSQYKPNLKFPDDEFILEIFSKDPIITLFEGENKIENESLYHMNMQQGVPEILLEEASKYEMVGVYGHEYTHHTQAISAIDIIKLVFNMNDEEKEYEHGIFRALREGQALKMEEQVAKLYADKTHDANYYRFISKEILGSMTKVYNALDTQNKSDVLQNFIAFRNSNQKLLDGNIGITYFMLNNLSIENYYDEFIDRFVK
ncbi:hypothetical protein KAR52_01700 [Candidatus Pacearchaeota archaeon]|nr:hypothetical protein [Candidatus Pacearchaeota archaeon]